MTLSLRTIGFVALCGAIFIAPGIVHALGERHRAKRH